MTPRLEKLLAFVGRSAPKVAQRVTQMRRDFGMIEARVLRGERPSPLLARAKRANETSIGVAQHATVTPISAKTASTPVHTVTILDGDAKFVCTLRDDEFVLQAALEAGANVPFSCTLGGCGTCRMRLLEGDYVMEEPNCLTPEERDQGFVLICVGRPLSPCVLSLERNS